MLFNEGNACPAAVVWLMRSTCKPLIPPFVWSEAPLQRPVLKKKNHEWCSFVHDGESAHHQSRHLPPIREGLFSPPKKIRWEVHYFWRRGCHPRGPLAKTWSHDSLEVPIRGPGPCLVSRSRISSAFCAPPCGNAIGISNDDEGLGTQGSCVLMFDNDAPSLAQYPISAVVCGLKILPN